jgi:transposase
VFDSREAYQTILCSKIKPLRGIVWASELAAARAQIAQLQRMLGKKTMEAEILKEAVEFAREKKWIARSPLLGKDDQ